MTRAHDAAHLARRFFGSLRPGGPARDDDRWARSQLTSGEQLLWERMSDPDRRHAVGVARQVADALGDDATRPVLAAALLHDVGKVASGFGTFTRVGATVVREVAGAERARQWGRLGLYVRHPEIGADLLRTAGSDSLTVAWAAEHHLPEARWTVPARVGSALKAADDD